MHSCAGLACLRAWIYERMQLSRHCELTLPRCCHAALQFRRFVMEDRFSAIRVAIGTAQAKDTVVIAGKGAEDYQEYGDMETGDLIRVGCRFVMASSLSMTQA